MTSGQIRLLSNLLSLILAPVAKAAWAFLKMKFKIGKNNTKIEAELSRLKKALEEFDDETPITEEQKTKVIDAARDLLRDV